MDARVDPLLRPTSDELTVAPQLGVLAALDATLATAAYQLQSEHPELSLVALARGYVPGSDSRHACHLGARIHDLRAALRDYRDLVLHDTEDDATF